MIIEGGKTILETCIKDNLWDEMRIFCCNTIINEGIIKILNIEDNPVTIKNIERSIIDRGYENLFYQEKNHLVVDEDNHHTNRYRSIDKSYTIISVKYI